MKNIKKFYHAGLLALSLFLFENSFAQTISNHFFGENAWMPDTIGDCKVCPQPPCILNGKLHQQWGAIKNSGASIIRFGGIASDKNMPTNYQYIRMIDSVRANGMEPIIQVPFYNYRYSAQQAADIVKYLNVTKGKNIKYWIIANEPDLSYAYTTAAQIANYFRPFASAMKSVDPTILIIGPEIASFNKTIMTGLTTPNGPDDITGKDGAGHYYLDVLSFHTYPFNGSQSRSDVINKLTGPGSLDDHLSFLNTRVTACNTAHGRSGASTLKTAITEANVNWQNGASDDVYGVGANSFIGGQFWAEMMGIALKNGVDFINFWSVMEGNSTSSNIGFCDPITHSKKPSYHHFKMMADNFKGNFVNGTTNQPTVKSFGSQSSQLTNVLILNQDQSMSYSYTVRLNTNAVSGGSTLKININAGKANEYSDVIQSQSTVLLTFDATGKIVKKTEYSLLGQAVASVGPIVNDFITTGVASNTIDDSNFDLKVFPNPAVDKFTVQLGHENLLEKSFEIDVINLLGQQVFHKKADFLHGKEEVELGPSVAAGEYIVRVKDEQDNMLVKKMLLAKK